MGGRGVGSSSKRNASPAILALAASVAVFGGDARAQSLTDCPNPRAPSFLGYDLGLRQCVAVGGAGAQPNALEFSYPDGRPGQILNVAAGVTGAGSTDAVNGGQLNALGSSVASALGGRSTFDPATGAVTSPNYIIQGQTVTSVESALSSLDAAATTALAAGQNSVQYDGPAHTDITLGSTQASAPVAIHNLADATSAHDAVNLSQLQSALASSRSRVDAQVASLRFDLDKVDQRRRAGDARNAALAGIPQVISPGASLIGFGMGGTTGATAFALGISTALRDEHTVGKAGASYATHTNELTWNLGVGYQF